MSCHHENEEHSAFGPHLGDLAKRFQGAELLRHTLEPSREIHGDYHTYVFVMKDGRVIVGFVVKQDAREIHVVANPTISEEKSILQKKDIEARRIYTRSMMPEGLLDSLGRQDILDMLAFIQSAQTSKRQPAE
jgi:putative heme-binding domain-containing protein